MKRILTISILLCCAISASATVRYVAQTAGTFSGGIACNGQTAITPATFNGLTLAAGDLTYVCGTITVAQNTTGLQINNSGSSGNPIIIRFDSGAVMKSPAWPPDGTSGAIDLGGNSWITIDGQGNSSGGGGIIEATLNGDPGATCLGGSCSIHGDSNCVEGGTNSTNITIEGLSCIDMYVAIGFGTNGVGPNPGGGTCFYEHGNISGWTIKNNFAHDVGWCVSLQYDSGPSNGVTIANNQFYNLDHGIALGGPSASQTLENVNIYGNNIHDYSNWDTTNGYSAQGSWHHDGIHIWGDNDSGTDPITNVNIYNNTFGGKIGRNDTAHIFIERNGGATTNVVIFNNTLIDTGDGYNPDGLLTTGQDGGYKIYNNTFISNSSASDVCMGTSSSPNITFINNVVTGCVDGLGQGVAGLMYMAGGSALSGGLHNNIYGPGAGSQIFNYASSSWFGPFSTWQLDTGQDASPSAYTTNPNLTSTGVPNSGSPVIGVGANLTSLCTGNLTLLCDDITGAARPTTGAWTIGAYNYASGPPQASAPTFSPAAGSVTNPTTVTASTSTSGCGSYIYFDTNSTPTTNQTTYSVTTAVTLYAYVHGCPSYADSSISSAAYTITAAATPTFSPVAGTVPLNQVISISSSTSGYAITYCAVSTGTCTPGTSGSSVTLSTLPYNVCAFATASGYSQSSTACADYTEAAAAIPTFSPSAGAVANPTTVTASTSTSDGCTMYLDTSNPPVTAQSTYSVTTAVTLHAQAKGCSTHANSAVGSAAYTISGGSTYTITVSSITGHGTVTSSDSVLNCTTGTTGTCTDSSATGTVTLTFTALTGYSLASVTGCTLSGTTCTVTSAATITATFTVNSYTLSTTTTGTGSGTITGCAGAHNYGASYSCTVAPSAGSTLASVTGCSGSGTTTYAGTMPASACTVTATFNLTAPNPAGTPILTLM